MSEIVNWLIDSIEPTSTEEPPPIPTAPTVGESQQLVAAPTQSTPDTKEETTNTQLPTPCRQVAVVHPWAKKTNNEPTQQSHSSSLNTVITARIDLTTPDTVYIDSSSQSEGGSVEDMEERERDMPIEIISDSSDDHTSETSIPHEAVEENHFILPRQNEYSGGSHIQESNPEENIEENLRSIEEEYRFRIREFFKYNYSNDPNKALFMQGVGHMGGGNCYQHKRKMKHSSSAYEVQSIQCPTLYEPNNEKRSQGATGVMETSQQMQFMLPIFQPSTSSSYIENTMSEPILDGSQPLTGHFTNAAFQSHFYNNLSNMQTLYSGFINPSTTYVPVIHLHTAASSMGLPHMAEWFPQSTQNNNEDGNEHGYEDRDEDGDEDGNEDGYEDGNEDDNLTTPVSHNQFNNSLDTTTMQQASMRQPYEFDTLSWELRYPSSSQQLVAYRDANESHAKDKKPKEGNGDPDKRS